MKGSVAVLRPSPANSEGGPIDKDGQGPEDRNLQTIDISVALNGYTITYVYDDGNEEKYVHLDFDKVLEQLRKRH